MSGRPAVSQAQNKGFENSELYEQVEVVPTSQPENRYTESSFQAQPSSKTSTPVAVHVARKKEWRGKNSLDCPDSNPPPLSTGGVSGGCDPVRSSSEDIH